MTRFVLAFRGGMPKSPEDGEKMMAEWTSWMNELGDALVDPGAGMGVSRFLTGPDQEGPAGDPLSGYTVIEATDMDAALKIAGRNPIFSLGGTIEVAEQMTF